ncbi:DEAD/DEAH box helicase [Fictibacillus terranigra]|uniref:DEAD/DEAH box helicase n=1 Tax=Fictibacillus terranigra TaxID=3058424 RepID=A0ABT8ECH5_9BACL|nr:DEAD/DEAH box helicase [Fictibacillus sp. CENA-BCM004]MDN4075624.1 DEAD/DEAH box helicase [Fictibacillus sp. CENA-BCM004]
MIDVTAIVLHAKWLNDSRMVFWGEQKGRKLHVDDWMPMLFAWHKRSYYGTFIERDDDQFVYVSAADAFRLFTEYPHFFLKKTNWGQEALNMIADAQKLEASLQDRQVKPSFECWKKGEWKWEFDDSGNQLPDWLNNAVDELVLEEPERLDADPAFFDRFPFEHLLEKNTLYENLSEGSWLVKLGWKKDEKPFDVLLELQEPEDDGRYWNLDVLLEDKDNGFHYEWSGNLKDLPEEWQPFMHRIEEDLAFAGTLVPSLQKKDGSFKKQLTENEAWDFLNDSGQWLAEGGFKILLPSWWEALKDLQPDLKAKVKSSTSGYAPSFLGLDSIVQFDWKVSTGDIELSEEEFLKLVDSRRRLVKIKGKWFKLDPAFIREVRQVMKNVNRNGLQLKDILEQHLMQPAKEGGEEESSVLRYVNIELNTDLARMVEQLSEVKEIPIQPTSPAFRGTLRDYQKTGSSWLQFLRKFGLGGCLADDMGLGKTIQTIDYLLQTRKEDKEAQLPALLICPTSVIGNWQKELQHFSPDLNVFLHYGSTRIRGENFIQSIQGADVVLTSYTTAQLDEEDFQPVLWDAIILDEAQNIKNSFTKQSRSIRRLSGRHKIALTGTPVENRLLELWAIFDFLNPGYLGSEAAFRKRFVIPVEREHDNGRLKQLQSLVQPFLLRRTKQDPHVQLNLPDKQEIKEYVHLTAEQASLYERMIQDTFQQLEQESGMKRRGLILALLGKLKQVCDHPVLYLKEEKKNKLEERSNKFSKLVELLEAIKEKDERCLIFTQFLFMGNLIQDYIANRWNEEVLFLHGGVPKAKRDDMIQKFQDGKHSVFVLSLKAGGTGLNLTEANHVIHFDRWWNPAVENQATDRAHRIGQKRFVTVHKMITLGTLEERIDEMLESKKELSEKVITSENWITELSTQELRELFVLRKEWVEKE